MNKVREGLRGSDFVQEVTEYFGREYDADSIPAGSTGRMNIINEFNEETVMEAMEDIQDGPSLPETGQEFMITHSKVRKVLITSGAYTSSVAGRIQEMNDAGMSVKEIARVENLSVASVQNYLPYRKTVYNIPDCSPEAQKVRDWRMMERSRQEKVSEYKEGKCGLADALIAFEGSRIQLEPGHRFSYRVFDEMVLLKDRGVERRYEIQNLADGEIDDYIRAIYKKMGLHEEEFPH